jgi:hypothetical protein
MARVYKEQLKRKARMNEESPTTVHKNTPKQQVSTSKITSTRFRGGRTSTRSSPEL